MRWRTSIKNNQRKEPEKKKEPAKKPDKKKSDDKRTTRELVEKINTR